MKELALNDNILRKKKKKKCIPYAQEHEIILQVIFHERVGAARSQGHRIPDLLSGEKKRKKKKRRCEKWRTRCKYIRFTAKSTGRKCAEGQSPSATGDHIRTYTHKDGIQGGGELPGRDLRLGHHLPEWPWLVEPPPPPAKYPTNIRILDRCDARACYPKYLRFDDRSRVAPQAPTSITAHANLTRAESTKTHLNQMCDTLSYILQIISSRQISIVISRLPRTWTQVALTLKHSRDKCLYDYFYHFCVLNSFFKLCPHCMKEQCLNEKITRITFFYFD